MRATGQTHTTKLTTFTLPGNRASNSITLLRLNHPSLMLAPCWLLLAAYLLACFIVPWEKIYALELHTNEAVWGSCFSSDFHSNQKSIFQIIFILFRIKQEFIWVHSERNCIRFKERMHFGNRKIFFRFVSNRISHYVLKGRSLCFEKQQITISITLFW